MMNGESRCRNPTPHDDVIKWKHFTRYEPFVLGIHWSPVNSPHKGKWCWALMFSLICAWINVWGNNVEVGDLGRHRAHYDVTVMPNPHPMHINWEDLWKSRDSWYIAYPPARPPTPPHPPPPTPPHPPTHPRPETHLKLKSNEIYSITTL